MRSPVPTAGARRSSGASPGYRAMSALRSSPGPAGGVRIDSSLAFAAAAILCSLPRFHALMDSTIRTSFRRAALSPALRPLRELVPFASLLFLRSSSPPSARCPGHRSRVDRGAGAVAASRIFVGRGAALWSMTTSSSSAAVRLLPRSFRGRIASAPGCTSRGSVVVAADLLVDRRACKAIPDPSSFPDRLSACDACEIAGLPRP